MAQLTAAAGNGEWRRMENGAGMPLDIWNFDWWLPSQPASALWLYLTISIVAVIKTLKKRGNPEPGLCKSRHAAHTSLCFPCPAPSQSSELVKTCCALVYILFVVVVVVFAIFSFATAEESRRRKQQCQKIASTSCLPLFGSPALAAVATLAALATLAATAELIFAYFW